MATVDGVVMLALALAAAVGSVLVRSRRHHRGRAYLMRRVRSQGPEDRHVVVEIEMPSFGRSRWRIVRRAGACGPSLLPVPADGANAAEGTGGGGDGAGELATLNESAQRI